METKINSQIRAINQSIDWVNKTLKSGRKFTTFKDLVDQRRRLRSLRSALMENPAIATYGESQKGKSYVISNLLADSGKPFKIKTSEKDSDGNCRFYNFIEDINPITTDTEATGVVTRFTSYSKQPSLYLADYPVRIKLLSITDLVTILCEGYFNDICNYKTLDKEYIDKEAEEIYQKYINSPILREGIDSVLSEDDIFDLQEYIQKYICNGMREVLASSYFDRIAQVITRIPFNVEVLSGLFRLLWGCEASLTSLFSDLLNEYQRWEFARDIYVPITAVLNTHNTMLGVLCLNALTKKTELSGDDLLADRTEVIVFSEGMKRTIENVNKAVLSALTAEVIFKIEPEYFENEDSFHLEGITSLHTLDKVGKNSPIKKELLKENDLLDFPGARRRENLYTTQIPDKQSELVLRGKVAFLFNKYSAFNMINILLFCHDYQQTGQSVMPGLLADWVLKNVGSNVALRTENIRRSVISPLFIIATKFNKDMEFRSSASANLQLDERWDARFKNVLYKQCLNADSEKEEKFLWFKNWTDRGSFKNTYLLRDYKYSGNVGGEASQLYSGFIEKGKETGELLTPVFKKSLRDSFIRNVNVCQFFEDPEFAWDIATSINNDGALYIIKNLSIAAENAEKTRSYRFSNIVEDTYREVLRVLSQYYHAEDGDDLLQANIVKFGSMWREMDIACGKDNYFFGRMIQKLQIKEDVVFNYYHELLHSTRLIENSNIKEYDLIRLRCGTKLDASKDDDFNWNVLCDVYHFSTLQAAKDYYGKRNIDLRDLVTNNYKKKCSNSSQLAFGILDKWFEYLMSEDTVNYFTRQNFDGIVLADFLENMRSVANFIHLEELIANSISQYVDSYSVNAAYEEMIADITASVLNNFVVNMGYEYLSEEKKSELKMLNEKYHIGLTYRFEEKRTTIWDEEKLSDLFDQVRPSDENSEYLLETQPAYLNYQRWMEYVTLSFLITYDVPDYDVEANHLLGRLIEDYKKCNKET